MPITLKQQHGEHSRSIEQLNIKKVLNSIKKQSEQELDRQTVDDIKSAMIRKQSTTYELMLLTQQEYIAHQFTKLKAKQVKTQAVAGVELLTQKFLLNHQLSSGNNSQIVIKNLSPNSFNQLNNELKQKLSHITSNIDQIHSRKMKIPSTANNGYNKLSKSFSVSQRSKSSQQNGHKLLKLDKNRLRQNISQILEFKQPGYWLKNEQKTKKIKQFLQHHQKQYKERHKRYKESVDKSWQKLQEQKKRQMEAKQQSKKQMLRKGLQKRLSYKQKRQNEQQQHENQLQRIEQFLQKMNPNQEDKRLYELLEENFKQQLQKEQDQYQEKLQKIKQQHAPLDPQQLQQHIQKYQQYKQSLKEQLQQKKQQFHQQLQQVKDQLSNLYHSKRYKKIAHQTQSPYKRSFSEIVNRKSKRKQFALSVKEKYKPQVSQKKKQQLEQSIKLLELSQDKSKRKVLKNGQLQYQDKQQVDRRKKGLEYLAFLKQFLSNKPKKTPRPLSTTPQQNSHLHKIDYLRQNKPNINIKAQINQWKKVMEDPDFNSKDKYTFLKESISTLQHKAIQKQIQARNLKKSPQELQKKDQFDKYYIQSIQAKMAILNNLMLGKNKH